MCSCRLGAAAQAFCAKLGTAEIFLERQKDNERYDRDLETETVRKINREIDRDRERERVIHKERELIIKITGNAVMHNL